MKNNIKTLRALVRKEFYQISRDPSSILIAFILPLVLLLIYMYGINMDTAKVTFGIKNDDNSPQVQTLISSFDKSKYIKAVRYDDKERMYKDLAASRLNGIMIIPGNFSSELQKNKRPSLLVITDGSEVNTANFVSAYAGSIVNNWLVSTGAAKKSSALIQVEPRFWFNQNINSTNFILPGSLSITMSLIGILLSALVIAREWERGTMEALISTKVSRGQIITSKYIAYFTLGMVSMLFSIFMCIVVFKIPFQGNLLVLFGFSSFFLFACLGIGFLISAKLKDQFLASQASLAIGFLPALLLSGLMFPIKSMPWFFQKLTLVLPPRYFVTLIQNEFMCGTIWEIVLKNSLFLAILGGILFVAVYKNIPQKLD